MTFIGIIWFCVVTHSNSDLISDISKDMLGFRKMSYEQQTEVNRILLETTSKSNWLVHPSRTNWIEPVRTCSHQRNLRGNVTIHIPCIICLCPHQKQISISIVIIIIICHSVEVIQMKFGHYPQLRVILPFTTDIPSHHHDQINYTKLIQTKNSMIKKQTRQNKTKIQKHISRSRCQFKCHIYIRTNADTKWKPISAFVVLFYPQANIR